MDVEGCAADGYEEVRRVFQQLVDSGLETGAGVSVRREGRTLGFVRDQGKIAKGGIGGSAARWSPRHHHACACLTRRLDDHSRAARIAAALGDDLTVVGED